MAYAVAYDYPTLGSGTLFVAGGSLDANTADTLTINGNSAGITATPFAQAINTGNVSILNSVPATPRTITASPTTTTANMILFNNAGNLTIPANVTFNSQNTGSSSRVISKTVSNGSSSNTITNDGTLAASGGTSSNIGISLGSFTRTITNTATGSITATSTGTATASGIALSMTSNTVTNAGVINASAQSGSAIGESISVSVSSAGATNNSGTISASSVSGSATGISSAGSGAFNPNNHSITNSGTISGTSSSGTGIGIDSSSVTTITNTGTITGSTFSIRRTLGTLSVLLNGGTLNGAVSAASSSSMTFGNSATTTVNGNVSITNFIVNASATANMNGTISSSVFTNNGTVIFNQTFTQTSAGTFTNNGTLAFDGNSSALSGNLTGTAGSVVFGHVTPTTTFSLASTISGFPSVTINSGSTLTVATGGAISTTTFTVTGSLVNDGSLSLGTGMTVAGTGAITNNAGKTLTLAGASFSAGGTITNNGTLAINSDTTMTSKTLTTSASGTVNVSGLRTLSATAFNNAGIQNFNITNAGTYDQLACSCPVTLSGTVNVISTFLSPGSYTWDVISGSSLTTVAPTLPADTNVATWDYQTIGGTTLRITLDVDTLDIHADSQINAIIAEVIDAMGANITNSGQQALINAFYLNPSNAAINDSLHQMIPNINTGTMNVAVQNNLFNSVQNRISTQTEFLPDTITGMSSGSLNPNTAVWFGGFGTVAKQKPHELNEGYKAKAAGSIFGLDYKTMLDDIYGGAFAISNSNIYEFSNNDYKTRILGYHALVYGANIYAGDYFIDWLFTGAFNQNRSTRPINLNGIDMAVQAYYNNFQAGMNLAAGKYFDLSDMFRFTQENLLQYTFIHQSPYTETGSVAALTIQQSENRSILTIGTGFRLALADDQPWLTGRREVHAFITYDALNGENITTANFVVGSNAFVITDNPNRIGLIAGVDYSLVLSECMHLQLSYNYEWRAGYYASSGEIALRYVF